jgi:quinol monooxygenase YgiN
MLIITAKVTIEKGKSDEFLDAYHWMKPKVLDDPGAIVYELHRSADDPDTFMFYEQYENREAFDYHLSTDHFKALAARIDPLMVVPGEIGMWREID